MPMDAASIVWKACMKACDMTREAWAIPVSEDVPRADDTNAHDAACSELHVNCRSNH